MQWVGYAELASAVSNAGGPRHPDRAHAADARRPAARDRALPRHDRQAVRREPHDPAGDHAAAVRGVSERDHRERHQDRRDRGQQPERHSSRVSRSTASRSIHKCTSVRHALSAERHGVDIVSIDGFECAGHPGEDDIPSLILIPAAVRALKIPIVASGGIGDGRGMAAALALGAQGINMGTRFMCTKEAPIHDNIKQALVAAGERDTNLMFRTMHNTARVFKNAISSEVVAMEKRGAKFEEVRHLVAGARGKVALRQRRSRRRRHQRRHGDRSDRRRTDLRRADPAHRARLPRALARCDRDGGGLSGRLSMDFKTIRYELDDGILTITLNRPDQLNAFTPQMAAELIDAFHAASADDAVKAVIVTGAGRAYLRRHGPVGSRQCLRSRRAAASDARGHARSAAGSDDRPSRARHGRPRDPRDLRLREARHRCDQRRGGRHRRDHDAGDGHPPRIRQGARRFRVRQDRHRARGLLDRGSCRASSASSRRSNGCTPRTSSMPRRRSAAGS